MRLIKYCGSRITDTADQHCNSPFPIARCMITQKLLQITKLQKCIARCMKEDNNKNR